MIVKEIIKEIKKFDDGDFSELLGWEWRHIKRSLILIDAEYSVI